MQIPNLPDGSGPARPTSKVAAHGLESARQANEAQAQTLSTGDNGVQHERAPEIGSLSSHLQTIAEIREERLTAVRERLAEHKQYDSRLAAEQTAAAILSGK